MTATTFEVKSGVENLNRFAPIGVMDSGVGGLSVLLEIRRLLPAEDILNFSDSGNCPYGVRPVEEIRQLTHRMAEFLLARGAKSLVLACNTASTAAVASLRERWKDIPIVGMVPAVKPAAETTRTGIIGVLSTAATGNSRVTHDVIDRFAAHRQVMIATPPGLVEAVENGEVDTPETRAILRQAIAPMLAAGADELVLGCTHYPFLRLALEQIVQGRMQIVDSGSAVARQTKRVLEQAQLRKPGENQGSIKCYTTGELEKSRAVIARLLGMAQPSQLAIYPVN